MAFKWAPKDPDERLVYAHDWKPRLLLGDTVLPLDGDPGDEAETKSPYTEVVEGTAQVDGVFLVNGVTTVWLIGGQLGETTRLTIRVHTAQGEVQDETFIIPIRAR